MPPSLQGHRLQLYGVFSTLLLSAVVASAFHKHSNFYSATVYLSRSSASVMVLANYGGFIALMFGRTVQRAFFGQLTNQEVERLYDRTWFFLTESLLAFTIFRDEFDAPFVVMFGVLLFLKCFHWLLADRMDWMDQQPYPGPSLLFHARTNAMFGILLTIDVLMLDFAIESVIAHGVSGIVLFGSEYAILLASLLNSILKYYVMLYDLRRARSRGGDDAPVWENKSMYMFYIELITDFLKLSTYLAFFTVVMTFFGLPLNIIRDVYMTGVSFYTRFRDLLRYRAATKDMETKYPDATEVELAAMSDRTCIICREDMSPNAPRIHAQPPEVALGPNGLPQPGQTLGLRDPPKKLPCGHVFHFQCLRSWLERQQSCPTCRRSVLEPANAAGDNNAAAQQRQQQQQQRPGLVPPPAPGAVPPPPGLAPPNGAPAAQVAAGVAGARARGGVATAHLTARSRSPAAAVAPRAFQGFSVGGEWHTWPVSALSEDASDVPPMAESSRSAATSHTALPAEEDTGSAGTATPTVVASSTTDSPSETAVATAAEPSPVEGASDPAQSTSPQESTTGVPAREAAATAALRRLNSMASSFTRSKPAALVTKSDATNSSSIATSPTSNEPQASPTPSPTRTTTLSPQIPSTSASASANSTATTPAISFSSQPSTSTSTSKSASPPPSKPTSLPSLIPLFDPSSIANRPFINLSNIGLGFDMAVAGPLTGGAATPGGTVGLSSRARTYSTSSLSAFAQANSGSFPWGGGANAGLARTPAGSVSSTPMRVPSVTSLTSLNPSSNLSSLSQPQPIPHPSRTSSSYFAEPPGASVPGAVTTPLQIPSVLTDDVLLRRLDAWTREAIDERLRVLEDVQQSLWRAAAELQRVQSALPPTPTPTTSTTNQQVPPIVSSANAKGKGRAVFDVQEEDEEGDAGPGGAVTDIPSASAETVLDPPFP